MNKISDEAIDRLRIDLELPDFSSTKYRIIEVIGRGGMGTVYLADDLDLARKVALKVISIADPSGELARRMLKEARIIAQLEHPGIVPVHDLGSLPDGRVYYAMKYIQGTRLDQFRKRAVSLSDLLRVFQKVCDAVGFGHAHGVIHRDLKPENVMVGPFGEVLVMDWGVAKILAEHQETMELSNRVELIQDLEDAQTQPPANNAGSDDTADGTVIGTPAYMAPEQRSASTCVDARSDVYALGATLFFLLSGRSPRSETRLRELNSVVPKRLEAICTKAMSPDRTERYATAEELSGDIARFLDGTPLLAYRENLLEKITRWLSKNRFLLLLIAAYLIMRILVLLFFKR